MRMAVLWRPPVGGRSGEPWKSIRSTGTVCNGAADGSIALTASGGTGALNYGWDNGRRSLVEDPRACLPANTQ